MWTDLVTVNGSACCVTDLLFTPQAAPWLRAAVQGTRVAAVAQAGPGTCQVVDSVGHRWDAGEIAFGINPVGIVANEAGGWRVYWADAPSSGAHFRCATLDAALQETRPRETGWMRASQWATSQGFLQIVNGQPLALDDYRSQVYGPVTIGMPITVGPYTVGQDWTSGYAQIVVWDAVRQIVQVASTVNTPVPSHLTILGDGSPAVCPGLTDQIIYATAFQPWHLQPTPDPPDPTPTPEPNPDRDEVSMLHAALTLKRSLFKDGGLAGRKLYPDLTNPSMNLSIDALTLEPRPGGLPATGPSESFIVSGDRARVDFGTHEATFLVTP